MKKVKFLGLTLFEVNVFVDEKIHEGYKLVGKLNIPGNWYGFLHVMVSIPFLPFIPDFLYAWQII